MMRSAAALCVILSAVCARADEVVLKSGRKVVGMAREEGKLVIVEIAVGTVTFAREEVVSITPGRTALHEYQERHEAIRESGEAADFYTLAQWAQEKGLARYVRPLLKRTLELDADHEWARRQLGFQRHNGRWMTQAEIYREQGFILFEGRWMSELEMNLIIRGRLDAKLARAAEEEERRKRRDEQERARQEALREERDRQAEERRRQQLDREYTPRRIRVYRPYGYGYGDGWSGMPAWTYSAPPPWWVLSGIPGAVPPLPPTLPFGFP